MSSAANTNDISAILTALNAALRECERRGISDVYLATEDGGHDDLVLTGNRCGLLHLAAKLVALAGEPGSHLHLDQASELERCWKALIISHLTDPW